MREKYRENKIWLYNITEGFLISRTNTSPQSLSRYNSEIVARPSSGSINTSAHKAVRYRLSLVHTREQIEPRADTARECEKPR